MFFTENDIENILLFTDLLSLIKQIK
jgi:hypothetical protein